MSDTPSSIILPPIMSPLEVYQLVRSQIEHEDNLVTQRLNWFLASQSFLFTAYAITANGPGSTLSDRRHAALLAMIPLIAICTAVLVFLTVMAGLIAMRHLHVWMHRHATLKQIGGLPVVQGSGNTRVLGMTAPVLLPLIFIAVWIWLMTGQG